MPYAHVSIKVILVFSAIRTQRTEQLWVLAALNVEVAVKTAVPAVYLTTAIGTCKFPYDAFLFCKTPK